MKGNETMYTIKRKEFNALRKRFPDFIHKAFVHHEWNGKKCLPGEWTAIAAVLPGYPLDIRGGCALVFEHIHFEIID